MRNRSRTITSKKNNRPRSIPKGKRSIRKRINSKKPRSTSQSRRARTGGFLSYLPIDQKNDEANHILGKLHRRRQIDECDGLFEDKLNGSKVDKRKYSRCKWMFPKAYTETTGKKHSDWLKRRFSKKFRATEQARIAPLKGKKSYRLPISDNMVDITNPEVQALILERETMDDREWLRKHPSETLTGVSSKELARLRELVPDIAHQPALLIR